MGRRDHRRNRPVLGPAGSASQGLRVQQVLALVLTVTGSSPSSCRRQFSAELFTVNDAFSQTAYGLGRAGHARGSGSQPNGLLPTPCWPARARREPGNGNHRGPGMRAAYGPLVQLRGTNSRQVRELGGGTWEDRPLPATRRRRTQANPGIQDPATTYTPASPGRPISWPQMRE